MTTTPNEAVKLAQILRSMSPDYEKMAMMDEVIADAFGSISVADAFWFGAAKVAEVVKQLAAQGSYTPLQIMEAISVIILDAVPPEDYIPHGDLTEIEEAA